MYNMSYVWVKPTPQIHQLHIMIVYIPNIIIWGGVPQCPCPTKNPPKIKGFTKFRKISKHRFHGLGVYVLHHLTEHVIRVPYGDEELDMVHIIK